MLAPEPNVLQYIPSPYIKVLRKFCYIKRNKKELVLFLIFILYLIMSEARHHSSTFTRMY